MTLSPARYRSKTLTAWLALLLGTLGVHRFYLHGWRDRWAWAYWPFTLIGLGGAIRMNNLGQDDAASSGLVLLLGLSLSAAMLTAIVTALTPDEKWDAHHNPALPGRDTAWGPVLAAIAALMMGAAALISTLTFGIQRYFEWEQAPRPAATVETTAIRTASR